MDVPFVVVLGEEEGAQAVVGEGEVVDDRLLGADDEPRVASLVARQPDAPCAIVRFAGCCYLNPGRVVGDRIVPGEEREVAGLYVVNVLLEQPPTIDPYEGLSSWTTPRLHRGGRSGRSAIFCDDGVSGDQPIGGRPPEEGLIGAGLGDALAKSPR